VGSSAGGASVGSSAGGASVGSSTGGASVGSSTGGASVGMGVAVAWAQAESSIATNTNITTVRYKGLLICFSFPERSQKFIES
jgi:hypothetical protein